MILDLRQFEDFPARTTLEVETGAVAPYREDVVGVDSIVFDVSIQKAGEEYFCQGEMKALVRMECARCLGDFTAERYEAVELGNWFWYYVTAIWAILFVALYLV